MITQLFALWTDGLAAAWIEASDLLRHRRVFQLRAHARPLTLNAVHGSTIEPVVSFADDLGDKLPRTVLEQTRGGIVEIVVPPAAILQRRLDPLPAESAPYLEQVVAHQVEALFPWRAEQILHSTVIEKRPDGALDVTVRATARSAIATELAAAEACGASEIQVVSEGKDVARARTNAIIAAVGSENQQRSMRAQSIARYAVIALLVLAAVVIGWTTFTGLSLSSDVAALDREIVDRRAIINRLADAAGAGHNSGLEAKKRSAPIAVVVLDELSVLLPGTTYLTDLTLDGAHLRISGMSANAADLVPLLEGSGHFKNASFYAPTTRLAGGSTDRFSIEATVAPHPTERQ